jgi:tetrahydromethanopterin S-methyltransferase subunit C
MIPVLILFLIVPVTLCSSLGDIKDRGLVVAVATGTFIAMVAGLTSARTIELLVAGATYASTFCVCCR